MDYNVRIGDAEHTIDVTGPDEHGAREARAGDETRSLAFEVAGPNRIQLRVGDTSVTAFTAATPDGVWISVGGRTRFVQDADKVARRRSSGPGKAANEVTPPMPAQVDSVLVAVGDVVTDKQPVIVVSAMKTKMKLTAPYAGTVTAVNAGVGAQVMPGDILVEIEPESGGEDHE